MFGRRSSVAIRPDGSPLLMSTLKISNLVKSKTNSTTKASDNKGTSTFMKTAYIKNFLGPA